VRADRCHRRGQYRPERLAETEERVNKKTPLNIWVTDDSGAGTVQRPNEAVLNSNESLLPVKRKKVSKSARSGFRTICRTSPNPSARLCLIRSSNSSGFTRPVDAAGCLPEQPEPQPEPQLPFQERHTSRAR